MIKKTILTLLVLAACGDQTTGGSGGHNDPDPGSPCPDGTFWQPFTINGQIVGGECWPCDGGTSFGPGVGDDEPACQGETTGDTGSMTTAGSQSGSQSGPDPDTTAGDDTSVGECGPGDFARYTCQGWIMAAHVRPDTGVNGYFFNNEAQAECTSFDVCIPFAGETDTQVLYDACKDACDLQIAEDMLPVNTYPLDGTAPINPIWEFDRFVCVFGDNGFRGYVPDGYDGLYGGPGGNDISGIMNTVCPETVLAVNDPGPDLPQVIYQQCGDAESCTEGEGQLLACSMWNPGLGITTAGTGTSTRVYVTEQVATDFAAGMSSCLYSDPQGKWNLHDDGWRFSGLSTGDFYHLLGFRNLDRDLRVRKNPAVACGTNPAANCHDLSTLGGILDAYADVGSDSLIRVEYKRQATRTGPLQSRVMTIEIVP